jgi:hypothetical protein
MDYSYIDSGTPLRKINYSYSKYYGEDFIHSWRRSRHEYLSSSPPISLEFNSNLNKPNFGENNFIGVDDILDYWIGELVNNRNLESTQLWLLLKRFEVTKKIYNDYSSMMRPSSKENVARMEAFAKWGIVLGLSFEYQRKLPLLNALLKVNDIVISHPSNRCPLALFSVRKEIELIDVLMEEKLSLNDEK